MNEVSHGKAECKEPEAVHGGVQGGEPKVGGNCDGSTTSTSRGSRGQTSEAGGVSRENQARGLSVRSDRRDRAYPGAPGLLQCRRDRNLGTEPPLYTFTTRQDPQAFSEWRRYAAVNGVGALLNLGIFFALIARFPRLAAFPLLPLVLAASVALLFNFVASRQLAFQRRHHGA